MEQDLASRRGSVQMEVTHIFKRATPLGLLKTDYFRREKGQNDPRVSSLQLIATPVAEVSISGFEGIYRLPQPCEIRDDEAIYLDSEGSIWLGPSDGPLRSGLKHVATLRECRRESA
jgi:hypothetical protein